MHDKILGSELPAVMALAYLGDARHAMYVRRMLVERGMSKSGELNEASLEYVTAEAQAAMMREIEFALELGSKKIVFGSGPDDPSDHNGAKERFFEFIMKVTESIPSGVSLSFEPTDWDIHKRFLFGPLDETVDFIKRVRAAGVPGIGLLIDMCHVPIIHETLESAIDKGGDVLNHIHLGNAVIKNAADPLYGDCHPAWSYPGSEFTEDDAVRFIKMLGDIGYLGNEGATVSFEMRPYTNTSSEESLEKFVSVWKRAIGSL